jgi:hypothetical protein
VCVAPDVDAEPDGGLDQGRRQDGQGDAGFEANDSPLPAYGQPRDNIAEALGDEKTGIVMRSTVLLSLSEHGREDRIVAREPVSLSTQEILALT